MLANQADADLKARSLSISPWLRAEGTVDRPLNYTGLNLDVALRGPDLQMLGAALQLPLPATPPYMLTGKLTHQDEYERWKPGARRRAPDDRRQTPVGHTRLRRLRGRGRRTARHATGRNRIPAAGALAGW
jgi:hypothetical protein